MRKILPIFICFFLIGCNNQFAYKKNNWVTVTQTTEDRFKSVSLDKNRLECDGDICRAWVKLEFGNEEAIQFTGEKPGDQAGYLMVKRVDSSVDYNCKYRTARINSYQLYNKSGELIDTKWIDSDLESAKAGTVHGDVLNYVCGNKN